jgi:hypothetical protein
VFRDMPLLEPPAGKDCEAFSCGVSQTGRNLRDHFGDIPRESMIVQDIPHTDVKKKHFVS